MIDKEEIKRTPQEWCDLLGARIEDPDGWRDGTSDWSEPIGREEFDRRLILCTIDSRGYPMFYGRPTARCLACEREVALQLWRGTYKDHSCNQFNPPDKIGE